MTDAARRLLLPPRLSAAALGGPEARAVLHSVSGESMGTRWTVKLAAAPRPPRAAFCASNSTARFMPMVRASPGSLRLA